MKTFSVPKITWSPVIILFLFKWLPWLYTKCNQIWWPYWNSDSNDLLSSNIWLSPLQPCLNFTVQSNSFLNEYYCVVLHWITLLQTQHACFVMITTVGISSNLQPTDCSHHHPAIILLLFFFWTYLICRILLLNALVNKVCKIKIKLYTYIYKYVCVLHFLFRVLTLIAYGWI